MNLRIDLEKLAAYSAFVTSTLFILALTLQ
jgi:hypothetical protein